MVATTLALRGLSARPGRDLLLADGARAFPDGLVDLLDDPARRAAPGRAAREYATREHSWEAVAASYELLYGGVATEARGRTHAGARA